jgi:hypothetical protein
MIGMSRIDDYEKSGEAIDAKGMKITLEGCIFKINDEINK